MSFFPIGDLHIESLEQSKIFSDYLNSRKEDYIVLLGDIIHFANSIWNSSKEISIEQKIQNIPKDISIWQEFLRRLSKRTIYYFGSHEMFALPVVSKKHPSIKLKIDNPRIYVPKDFEVLPLSEGRDRVFITGIHIPANLMGDVKSQEFIERKKRIEVWIKEKALSLKVKRPKETILCSHDPADFHYVNMGYNALTKLLQEYPFKAHYHAHIHSNIRNPTIGQTPSINRSFIALAQFEPEALEPSTAELRSLYGRKI
ncbi:MAG: metallophosphoesterase [archaeon]|nr:metallophosphoesterase [archaeon]MCP8313643.1 metallophosphoesterase [archaeon]